LTLADLQEASAARGDELRRMPDRETTSAAQVELADDRDLATFAVSDGRSWALLRTGRSSPVDAAVLHEVLMPAWGVSEEQVGYHHSLEQALHTTARQPGIVVAVHPPTVDQVMQAAARGVRMPHKSTSFGPKPRMGIVMRDLTDA
jgi:hypothetical protein